jgi:transposase
VRPRLLPVRLVTPNAGPTASTPPPVPDITPAPIEVVLRNGRVLRVAATAALDAVARLAAALEA